MVLASRLAFWIVTATLLSCATAKTLLVSFDGFRWDYLKIYRNLTSNFHYLRDNGASTSDGSIIGTFVTKTFPSHFTIATGVYEETHGIVSNIMYDPLNGATFQVRNKTAQRDPFWWHEGTPIWIVAERQNRRSGTFFWPGSEVKYGNTMQYRYKRYNESYTLHQRIDTVVDWLEKGTVEFATLYYHQPDRAGHQAGPYSKKVKDAVAEVNEGVGYLIKKLRAAKIFESTNLIILSDHGMANIEQKNIILLWDYLKNKTNLFERLINTDGPIVDFVVKPGKADELYNYLKDLIDKKVIKHASVHRKGRLQERFHYEKNRRIPEVFILAELNYYLWARETKISKPTFPFGTHGYDNIYRDMRPIFIARGPKFKSKARVSPFRQVDVYNLLAKVIGVKPGPNNGSWENVAGLYNSAGKRNSLLIDLIRIMKKLLSNVFETCVRS